MDCASRSWPNASLWVPANALVELVVRPGFGKADDSIAEGNVVGTADIPLAARCVAKDARVLDPKGRRFRDKDIGAAPAMRDLIDGLRQASAVTGGPAPMASKDCDELSRRVACSSLTRRQACHHLLQQLECKRRRVRLT